MTNDYPADAQLIAQGIRRAARAHRMTPDDADDFAQYVHLKLLERRDEVMRQFAGRSSLATYLTVVIKRLAIDWQRTTRGKWCPSAAATRHGAAAIELDRLIHRDGRSLAEAIALVHARTPMTTPADLWRLTARLTPNYRRQFVGDAALEARMLVAFDDPIERRDQRRAATALAKTLAVALCRLSPDDRELVCARVLERRTIQSLARERGQKPCILYRRYQQTLLQLRRHLEQAGVTGSGSVDALIATAAPSQAA